LNSDDILKRNNVSVIGSGEKTLLLAHGFGCDQNMWRFLTPLLIDNFRIVLFDYVGSGKSDVKAFDAQQYLHLDSYAQNVIDVCEALELKDVTLVGHSVSSMIGLIASIKAPHLFARIVMVCPSPSFLNAPPDYFGGFERADLEELIDLMDKNYIGWANYLAPLVMGSVNGEGMISELSGSFCSTDPVIAKSFAKATFFSDCRHLLPLAQHPTLVFQSSQDALAAVSVGEFVAKTIPQAGMLTIDAEGHCLHMTHPHELAPPLTDFAMDRR